MIICVFYRIDLIPFERIFPFLFTTDIVLFPAALLSDRKTDLTQYHDHE